MVTICYTVSEQRRNAPISGRDPCAAPAGPHGLCAIHANPERAKELGARGGRGNRHVQPDTPTEPMRAPTDAAEVRMALAKVMADVHNRQLDTRVATCVTYTASALLKAMELSDLEARIKRLEGIADGAQKQIATAGK